MSTLPQTVERILGRVRRRTPTWVAVCGAQGLVECQLDPAVRRVFQAADIVTTDGMPLVWLGRIAGYRVERVYGPDLMLALCEAGLAQGLRHFFCGGPPGLAERLRDRLRTRWPSLAVVGTMSPPFGDLDDRQVSAIADALNKARADIAWIGLSTPKQELLMHRLRPLTNVPVLIGVGAAFDFHAGVKPQAPRWIRQAGFEWLFRLATEPRRLWKRYTINNLRFLWFLARDAIAPP